MKSVAALVGTALVSTAHADDLVDDPLAKDATIATALTVTGIALPVAAIANAMRPGASRNLGRAMMISGAWMVVGSWAYDLIESRRAVRRHNERRRAQLLPFFGSASAGIVLGGDF